MKRYRTDNRFAAVLLILLLTSCDNQSTTPPPDVSEVVESQTVSPEQRITQNSQALVPTGPWPVNDQRGMSNTLGAGTWMRCAHYLSAPGAKVYELSHLRSNTMSMSPFGVPLEYGYRPTAGLPGSLHAFNGEQIVTGEPGAQGTQMDALGHFAVLPEPWNGESPFPSSGAEYYGNFTQADVKPTADSPLLKLGIEQASPIVTSAVLLDAKEFLGSGLPLKAGRTITQSDIESMIEAQGLSWRGLLPGDVVYVYTGWGDDWNAPDYYTKGPGLSLDAAKYLESKRVVLVALDNPFTDPVNEGQLTGEVGPAEGAPDGLPFAIHHYNLTQSGIHQIQNMNLGALAADKVWTSCTMILPLRSQGASGSPVRPVAIGSPHG